MTCHCRLVQRHAGEPLHHHEWGPVTERSGVEHLRDMRVMQIRHPHRLACEILDQLRRQPRGPSEELDDAPAKTGAPVGLENMPASAYAHSDGNELGSQESSCGVGSSTCAGPCRVCGQPGFLSWICCDIRARDCKFRTLDGVPAITQPVRPRRVCVLPPAPSQTDALRRDRGDCWQAPRAAARALSGGAPSNVIKRRSGSERSVLR